jgi:hypothetical protein
MISLGAKKLSLRSLAGTLAFLMVLGNAPLPAPAQEFQDSDDDIEQTVARISYISGAVSYGRGDDPDDWDPAITNLPFTLGDRIYSSPDGRAELQLPGGNFVRIGRGSYLTALTLTYDTKQFYLGNGAATVHIRRLDPDDIFEIDTPNVAVTFDTPGRYRVEVDDDGNTRVIVRRGTAVVAADGREVTVEQAEMRITGMDAPRYEIVGLGAADAFDRWVDEREGRYERAYRDADRYANERIVGLEDLADHGRWEEIPEYGYAWTPTRVAVGWQPFTVGHWFWQDPWGWTWISEEPWGWAPCHYGRWTYYRSRWYWVPVERRVRVVRYVPAVVEIVYVGGHVGWFPLHPRDRFVPWWSRRARVEEVTYVNRTRVVVIDQETFVSARRVTTRIVRDTTIIREVTTVRVRERILPIPRRESIRVAVELRDRQVQRPPANVLSRPVVVRTAPAPPPPRFDEKLRVIRERKGQPLAPQEIVSLGAKEFKANQRARIRPAAEGRGGFAPAKESPSTPPPRSVTPSKGRKLATRDEPVLTDLPRRRERQPEKQEKQVQEQERKDQKRDELQIKKQEKEIQEQKQKDQQREKQDQERQQKDQERQKKQQEQDRQKQEKLLQEQQRDQEREKQEQGRKQKLEEQQRQKQEKQLQQQQQKEQQQRDAEQRREQERQRQQDERERQKQLQEQQKKDQQLRQQQQREEQQQREQERLKQQDQERQQRLQEQERQKQLKEQQRQQQQSQKEQQRQELERQRLERQQQQQQQPQEEQARQKQLQEQRRLQKQREEQKRRQEQGGEAPAPTGPTTPPPPPPR